MGRNEIAAHDVACPVTGNQDGIAPDSTAVSNTRQSRRLNSRQALDTLEQSIVEGINLFRLITRLPRIDLKHQHIGAFKSQVETVKILKATYECARGNQQQQRQRNLCRHQQAADAKFLSALR